MSRRPLPDSSKGQEQKDMRRLSRRVVIASILGAVILLLLVLVYLYA